MASPSELSLDCKPQSYSMLLKSFGSENTTIDQTQKLEEFLSRLEEERLKIEAFKRELPLCMQLLTNAVEVYRQQLQTYRANNNNSNNQSARLVLEEFIPLKNSNTENQEKADKASWMTSAQLWSQAVAANCTTETKTNVSPLRENTDIALNVTGPQLGIIDTKQRNGGAFLPFSKERTLPELALSNPSDPKEMEVVKNSSKASENGGNGGGSGADLEQGKGQNGNLTNGANNNNSNNNNYNNMSSNNGSTTTAQTHRKARRCWSPDLHRRFVNALQMLGGSQVATPKQIRELMKVDGLTNDEVKSHLQKYRLHTRRPSPSPPAPGGPAPQLVVLGGIWVPPEYAAHHGGPTTLYHHHHHSVAPAPAHAPPHFCAPPPPVPQEFYSAAGAPTLPQPLHHHHHQFQHYKTVISSPDSPSRRGAGGVPVTEGVEEGKSESGSWKAGESGGGENGGVERKGLAALREEGEESNGSEITLKF